MIHTVSTVITQPEVMLSLLLQSANNFQTDYVNSQVSVCCVGGGGRRPGRRGEGRGEGRVTRGRRSDEGRDSDEEGRSDEGREE